MTKNNTGAVLPQAEAPEFKVGSTDYPTLSTNGVIVKTAAVAINPVDWMQRDHAYFPMKYPTVLGIDVAGTVEEVGSEVKNIKVGQRVLAHAGYFNEGVSTGSFQQYVLAIGVATIPIPDSLSFTDAVVLPLGFSTAAAGLYEEKLLNLPHPEISVTKREGVILVWGGSTSVGSNAIQLARASGYEVFATAGPHNKEYVKELGVESSSIFDHTKDGVAEDIIKALENKKLVGIYDCVSKDPTKEACRKIAKAGGIDSVIGVLPGGKEEDGVTYKDVFAVSIWFNKVAPAVYGGFLEKALEKGSYLARPKPQVVGEGLESISKALDKLKAGVSATKLVVTL